MADFSKPLSLLGERRFPTTIEKEQGFPCGPADRLLFNGLFHRLESEIGHVIAYAGLTPTDDRFTQLREAIEQLIGAAIGALPEPEDPEQPDLTAFLTLAQARSRLPIYPHVSGSGIVPVTAPATGTIRVAGGYTILHRGIYPVVTVQTDLATAASRTYHVRMNLNTGVVTLENLQSSTYNASGADEWNANFDSSYDDVLLARVTTNSSNVATITTLRNDMMHVTYLTEGANCASPATNSATYSATFDYNLARTPMVTPVLLGFSTDPSPTRAGSTFAASDPHDHDTSTVLDSKTRYRSIITGKRDYAVSVTVGLTVIMGA